jgi:hypothetical protein
MKFSTQAEKDAAIVAQQKVVNAAKPPELAAEQKELAKLKAAEVTG